jgi:hypothetical protein
MKDCDAANFAKFIKMLPSLLFVPYISGELEKVYPFEGTEGENE